MNRDLVTNIDPKEASRGTMHVLDSLQSLKPEQQVVALALTFRLLLEKRGIQVQDAMEISDRALRYKDGSLLPEYRAARMYVQEEM